MSRTEEHPYGTPEYFDQLARLGVQLLPSVKQRIYTGIVRPRDMEITALKVEVEDNYQQGIKRGIKLQKEEENREIRLLREKVAKWERTWNTLLGVTGGGR